MNGKALQELQVAAFGLNGVSQDGALATGMPSLSDALLEYNTLITLNLPERKKYLPFLPEAGTAMVFGPRGIGKTFFELSLAAALTTGQPFLRWNVTAPCGVLYVDGEMQLDELRDRMTALLPEPPKVPLFFLTSDWTYHKLQRDLVLRVKQCETKSAPYLMNIPPFAS